MARPIRPAPSRGVLVVMAVLVAVAVLAAILSFGNGPGSSATPSPGSPSPSATSATSEAASPSPTTSTIPTSTDTPAGVARWTAISPAGPGPAARSGHTWTVDPSSAVAYLFGGRGAAGALDDVWSYDLTADRWTELRPNGERPGPRYEHGAAWIDGLGLVVFGGQADGDPLDDFWAFDPSANAWGTVDVAGRRPSARSAACLAMRANGQLWMFGGLGPSGTADAELWTYDQGPSSWTQREAGAGPEARSGAACWWSSDDRLIVHGGLTPGPPSAALGDLWAFDPDDAGGTWQEEGDLLPRERGAWTTTSRGGVVAGGRGAGEDLLADVVVFDDPSLEATSLRNAPDGPAARSGAALADDPEGERVLMYGGRGASGPLGDVWALDLP